ncbi:hypothetical protein BJ875DRAFT_466215 [Amylocarpus encephaloides]|uniref:Pal1 cell morphology protein n=1 Tax=Amylocarpus encephaloides TaxID=45428 RepID=A0A9P7YFP1_9HELO|nr:hypothetical protein BJ875DRAFT_466215 [Amylocarpus encephaloides]
MMSCLMVPELRIWLFRTPYSSAYSSLFEVPLLSSTTQSYISLPHPRHIDSPYSCSSISKRRPISKTRCLFRLSIIRRNSMEPPPDKEWASKYLLDPLTAPEHHEETGPGSHLTRNLSTTKGLAAAATYERYQKSSAGANSSKGSNTPTTSTYPTPPSSASPTRISFHPSNPYSAASSSRRQSAFGDFAKAGPSKSSKGSLEEHSGDYRRRRGGSLGERFPGDMSHRPLDQIRKDTKAAHRSPHLRKKHLPGADTIDSLDRSVFGGAYHHEGPYDATLLARNTSYKSSPVAAVQDSNTEALKATPRENIRDALDRHVPLSGTSVIPPGLAGLDGKVMRYEEGTDLMREPDAAGGAYKRWDHVKYHPDDLKGKGEPSFSIERALKDHKKDHRRVLSDGALAYEMQPQRPRLNLQSSVSGQDSTTSIRPANTANNKGMLHADYEADVRRSNTSGRGVGEGLKKRFGSLRRSKKTAEV